MAPVPGRQHSSTRAPASCVAWTPRIREPTSSGRPQATTEESSSRVSDKKLQPAREVVDVDRASVDRLPHGRLIYADVCNCIGIGALASSVVRPVSKQTAGAVIHRNVALIACDTPATLAETARKLEELGDIDLVTLGDRHFMIPARQVSRVLARLKALGQFPRLLGEPVFEHREEGADAEPAPTENG